LKNEASRLFFHEGRRVHPLGFLTPTSLARGALLLFSKAWKNVPNIFQGLEKLTAGFSNPRKTRGAERPRLDGHDKSREERPDGRATNGAELSLCCL
jgi:hypothetical protein